MTDKIPEEGAATEEDDFEAAFNEHAEAKEPVIGSEQLDDDKAKDDEAAKLEDEAKIKAEEADAEKAALEATEKAKEDPYAGMSDEVKARVVGLEDEKKALEHKLSSDSGRVSAFQRRVTQLEGEVKEAKAGSAEEQPSNEQIASAMRGTDDDWDTFKEDYPAVANAIDRRLDLAGKATQESVDQTLAPVKERAARDEVNEAQAAEEAAVIAVADVYPTWTDEVKKPEFSEWLTTQPPGISSLANSDDPADAGALIGLYDGHLVANGKDSMKKADPGPGVSEEESGKPTDAVAARRARQLADGATVESKSARINPGDESGSEFEAAFEVFANRKEARRTA